jgi:omega-6 fatty acid desaturase (delta-12 desaturase)
MRWFTANIGVHHVHHLCSRIPCYRLSRILRDHPELKDVGRITLLQSLACVRLALWDESRRRMISFRQLRAQQGDANASRHDLRAACASGGAAKNAGLADQNIDP